MAAALIPQRPDCTIDGVTVRPAGPGDAAALAGLIDRCSDLTLYRRFHGATGPHVRREIERIAHPTAAHRSWVAIGAGGEVRGTATLAWGRDGDVHVAFLVADAWHRRGIGRALYAALAPVAVADGLPAVTATILGDNVPALRFLRAIAPRVRSRFVDGEVEVRVPVRATAQARPAPRRSAASAPPPPAAGRPRVTAEVAA